MAVDGAGTELVEAKAGNTTLSARLWEEPRVEDSGPAGHLARPPSWRRRRHARRALLQSEPACTPESGAAAVQLRLSEHKRRGGCARHARLRTSLPDALTN